MKVSELIEALQEMDPDSLVIMQKDSEGNGYSPLAGADPNGIYVADSTYSGEVYDAEWTADDAGMNCSSNLEPASFTQLTEVDVTHQHRQQGISDGSVRSAETLLRHGSTNVTAMD